MILFDPPSAFSPNDFADGGLCNSEKASDHALRIKRIKRVYLPTLIIGYFSFLTVVFTMAVLHQIASIIKLVSQVKVGRIYAAATGYISSSVQKLAVVQDFRAGFNRSKVHNPTRSMGADHSQRTNVAVHEFRFEVCESRSDNPIAILVECSDPKPAAIRKPDLTIKPLWEREVKALRKQRMLLNVTHSIIQLPVWGASQRAFSLYGS